MKIEHHAQFWQLSVAYELYNVVSEVQIRLSNRRRTRVSKMWSSKSNLITTIFENSVRCKPFYKKTPFDALLLGHQNISGYCKIQGTFYGKTRFNFLSKVPVIPPICYAINTNYLVCVIHQFL